MRDSLRSSLRSSFDPHSDPHSDPHPAFRRTTPAILHYISILTPILSDRRLGLDLWKSRLNRNRTATLLAASAAEVAGLGPRNSLACMVTPQGSCHQCREWQGEQGCGLGMEDMTGELRLIVLRKDCFAGCNDDDATTTQLATTCKVPSQVAGEDRGGEG